MTLTEFLTSIANAIRGKTGETGAISATQFADKIAAIETGVDTSDATAAAADILSGKTAYVNGSKLTGTIATKTSSDLSASGATVTVPAGYYSSQVSKSVSTATQATPSISVSSSGVITASATQSAGYVSSGTKSATKYLSIQSATTYTPTTNNQIIPSGIYLIGNQTIKGDSNLVADNIASGVSIFGVTGTGLRRWVTNDTSIIPTGTYATSTYYNTTYGVKIGYMPDGDILLSMRSGSTTAYEVLRFILSSAPDGVTLTAHSIPTTTAGPAAAIYACVLSGITQNVTISIAMSSVNSTYDYTTCAITVTAA